MEEMTTTTTTTTTEQTVEIVEKKAKKPSKKELIGMSIHPDDQSIIDAVSKKEPQYSKSFGKNKKAIDEPI